MNPSAVLTSRHTIDSDPGRVRVLIVDDHRIVREGLAGLLADQPDMEVVGQACDGRGAVAMARTLRPQVIIMDACMPDMDGVIATRQIISELPDIHVIALSMHNEKQIAGAMRQAGAGTFLCKTDPSEMLIQAVRLQQRSARPARRSMAPAI